MAPPRFLFPGGGGGGFGGNASVPSFSPSCVLPKCDGVCIYDACLPYPPPALPPFAVPDDPFTVHVQHKSSSLLPVFLISASSLIAFSFLLLLLFYFLFRLRRRRQQQQLRRLQPPPPPPLEVEGDLVFEDLDDQGNVPHHVWLIRTVGLDESLIKSIAAAVYKAPGDGGGDCTVCLGEFVDGEVVKVLPRCSHAFHQSCIDTWLRSHVSCPLCRAPVVLVPPSPPPPGDAAVEDPDSSHSNDTCIVDVQDEESAVVISLEEAGPSSSTNLNGNEVQPIRRSVSMDSFSLGMLLLRSESERENNEVVKSRDENKQFELQAPVGARKSNNKGKGVDSWEKYIGSVELRRSLSSRSARMFFSRYRCGRSPTVLPL